MKQSDNSGQEYRQNTGQMHPMNSQSRHKRHTARVLRVQIIDFRNLVLWAGGMYLGIQFLDAIAVTALHFLLGFFVAIALEPVMRWLSRHGLRRGFAAGILALLLSLSLIVITILALPPLAEQINSFVSTLPTKTRILQERIDAVLEQYPTLRRQIENVDFNNNAARWGSSAVLQIGRYSLTFFNGLMSLLLVIIIALYTLAAPGPLLRGMIGLFPKHYRFTLLRIVARLLRQYQAWTRTIVLLMFIVGTAAGVGLWVMGVENALIFAIIAGIGEVIPVAGPLLSAIPPLIVTLAVAPTQSLWVAVLYAGIQFLENYLLVPRLMGSNLDLHAISILFSVVALGSVFGPLGILIAAPVCVTIKILYQEIYQRHYQNHL